MFQKTRHFSPAMRAWDAGEAVEAIGEIVGDAEDNVDAQMLWPAHPMDGGPDGLGCVYHGAAGVIWALDYLRRAGVAGKGCALAPLIGAALARNEGWFASTSYPAHASLLMGALGILLVKMRVAPEARLADEVFTLMERNNVLTTMELMWGLPGSMLGCVHMHAMTGEARFGGLFRAQAERLLGELEVDAAGPIWTQDLYGRRGRWLGPVHGFAGNMVPLLRGWDWLTEAQQQVVAEAVPLVLAGHAVLSGVGANWGAMISAGAVPTLCQHCHGAPGMVTTFADAPFSAAEFEALLLRGGELTWAAGPLVKGSNLCHGTGGNGYALLKLYRRTGDARWLARARGFAMAAIDQVRGARAAFGRGRYSLWTGDVGLAVYLWDCVRGEPRFPTIDVW